MNVFILILLAGMIATMPSLFVKQYIKEPEIKYILFAMICYSLLIMLYIHIYKKEEISKAYPSILTLQIIFITMISCVYYKEKMTRNKMIGLATGFATIYFLTRKN